MKLLVWLLAFATVFCSVTGSLTEMEARTTGDDLLTEEHPLQRKATGSEHEAPIQRVVEWIRSKGGFVSSSVEIRFDDQQQRLGVFAKADLASDELILLVPSDCIIVEPIGADVGELPCGTAYALANELKLGHKSSFGIYLDLLSRSNELGYAPLPSAFTDAAKSLLRSVLGPYGKDSHLPPSEVDLWFEDDWRNFCDGSSDPLEQKAVLYTLQRHYKEHLVPLMDTFRHRQGKWTNVNIDLNSNARFETTRVIKAGEELYISLGDGLDPVFSVPNLFRDRGFIESYPQNWKFPRNEGVPVGRWPPLWFVLDQVPGDDKISLEWMSERPDDTQVFYFEEQIDRLESLAETHLQFRPANVPEREWNLIKEYHQSILFALKQLVNSTTQESGCVTDPDQTCSVSSTRYNMLDTFYGLDNYNFETCDPDLSLDLSGYKVLERVQTPYQNMVYFLDPISKNVCFDLDSIYQICGSYRPHYHEAVVHYTARFLPKLKRVLWVGGGDSMLLHEILKYPSVEIVIGLELDQKVTRFAFKYFGSQPHWDNDKVNWYYGDAAKSLMVLPKEYFGTFDLVLVDLSETVMSNTVTKGLDIMAALSLLLKPDGIFVKNEMYFEQLSSVFKHTLHVHYYDVPLICSQCLVLGSNSVDFVNTNLTDHGVDTLFSQMKTVDKDLGVVRDYNYNSSAKMYCKEEDMPEDEPLEQEQSPGVVMILEVERVAVDLNPEILEDTFAAALGKAGVSIASTALFKQEEGKSVFVSIFEAGYVIERSWPDQRYCALDIGLWGNFLSLEGIKNAILDALGSSAHSSFRIVTGGMFGLAKWKEEEKSRGPKFTTDCNKPHDDKLKTLPAVDSNTVATVLKTSMDSLLTQNEVTAAVMCGLESQPCHSLDVVSKHQRVNNVIPLWTCPVLEGINEYEKDSDHRKFLCEQEILKTLQELSSKTIGLIVLDPGASFAMGQVSRKIASMFQTRKHILSDELVVLAPTLNPADLDEWRSVYVDNWRLFYNAEPAFVSKLHFNSSDDSIALSAFSAGDELFISHVKEASESIKEQTLLSPTISNIGGVKFTMQEAFQPSEFFLASDYDQSGPYSQWKSQQPLAHQTIFQLELSKTTLEVHSLNKEAIKNMLTTALQTKSIDAAVEEFTNVGSGCVVSATWKDGNALVVWDGRDHVDLNLLTNHESNNFATDFLTAFTSGANLPLQIKLREEMPRGYGRVVNFREDIEPRLDPYFIS